MISITKTQNFLIIFHNSQITNTFVKPLNNRIMDQLKTKFAIIDVEKRRIYLRHLLTQTKVEREIDFLLFLFSKSKRNVFEVISSYK